MLSASFSSSQVVAGAVEGAHRKRCCSWANGYQAMDNRVWGFQLRPQGCVDHLCSLQPRNIMLPVPTCPLHLLFSLPLILQDATCLFFFSSRSFLGFHSQIVSFLSSREVVFLKPHYLTHNIVILCHCLSE